MFHNITNQDRDIMKKKKISEIPYVNNLYKLYRFYWDWNNPKTGVVMDLFYSFFHNDDNIKKQIGDIQNNTHLLDLNLDLDCKYKLLYEYNPYMFIALIFYIRLFNNKSIYRNIKTDTYTYVTCAYIDHNISNGNGNKDLSYNMMIWLLDHHEDVFIKNIQMFVSEIGYFKDCLNMANIIKKRINPNINDKNIKKYNDEKNHKIYIILSPMAESLLNDELLLQTMNHRKEKIDIILKDLNPKFGLSYKWAPREGKKFEWAIPYLCKLCNIRNTKDNNKKNMKHNWRLFLRDFNINSSIYINPTIETILSNKQFNKIQPYNLNIKSINLYNNCLSNNKIIGDDYKKYRDFDKKLNTIKKMVFICSNMLYPNKHPDYIIYEAAVVNFVNFVNI
jgi:hypothetical protein